MYFKQINTFEFFYIIIQRIKKMFLLECKAYIMVSQLNKNCL
jgi:hypothetical protein